MWQSGKHVALAALAVLFSTGFALAANTGEISIERHLALVRSGSAAATIVVPANPGKWTHEAANWIQHYLQKATGAKLDIVTDSTAAPLGALISVGHTTMASQAGIDLRGLKYDGCQLVVKGRVLYLIGRDDPILDAHLPAGDGSNSELTDWVGARGTCRAIGTSTAARSRLLSSISLMGPSQIVKLR